MSAQSQFHCVVCDRVAVPVGGSVMAHADDGSLICPGGDGVRRAMLRGGDPQCDLCCAFDGSMTHQILITPFSEFRGETTDMVDGKSSAFLEIQSGEEWGICDTCVADIARGDDGRRAILDRAVGNIARSQPPSEAAQIRCQVSVFHMMVWACWDGRVRDA